MLILMSNTTSSHKNSMIIERTLISQVITHAEHVLHFLHLLYTSPLFPAREAHLHAHLPLLLITQKNRTFPIVSPNLESGTHLSTHPHTYTHTETYSDFLLCPYKPRIFIYLVHTHFYNVSTGIPNMRKQ